MLEQRQLASGLDVGALEGAVGTGARTRVQSPPSLSQRLVDGRIVAAGEVLATRVGWSGYLRRGEDGVPHIGIDRGDPGPDRGLVHPSGQQPPLLVGREEKLRWRVRDLDVGPKPAPALDQDVLLLGTHRLPGR